MTFFQKPSRGRVSRRGFVAALVVAQLVSGTSSLVAGAGEQTSTVPRAGAALYDLERDEALGGHTLDRHTGKSDAELAARLAREPQISAASTYVDIETARRVVAAAIRQSSDRLESWSRRQGARPNLVLSYVQKSGPPIGRSLARGQRVARSCMRAVVVIRWHERRGRWYVLTSYPEASR